LVRVPPPFEQLKALKLSFLQRVFVPISPLVEKFKELVPLFSVLIEEAIQLKQEVACEALRIKEH
jgi:hypothetical protein